MKSSKVQPPTIVLGILILALFLYFLFPSFVLAGQYRLLGLVFVAFGLGLNIWADSLLKKAKTPVKHGESPKQLLQHGPFRISRHPMYLGFVLILLGVAVLLGSLFAFIAPLILLFIFEYRYIPYEEEQLEEYFGEKYKEYKKAVHRWL